MTGQAEREIILQLLFGSEAVAQHVAPGPDDPEKAVVRMAQLREPACLSRRKQGVNVRGGAPHLRNQSLGRNPARPGLTGRLNDQFSQYTSMTCDTQKHYTAMTPAKPPVEPPRLRQGSRAHRRHHAGDGLDDRVRHLHRERRCRAPGEFARPADCLLADRRGADHHRGAQLRRTGRRHATRRRPVCLSARSLRTPLGIPLRLDPLRRHPDRHHRGRRGRLRQIHRRVPAVDLGEQLPARLRQDRPDHAATAGDRRDRTSDRRSTRAASAPARWCRTFSPSRKSHRCSALVGLGFLLGRNPQAIAGQLPPISGAAADWSFDYRRAGRDQPWSARCSRPTHGTT